MEEEKYLKGSVYNNYSYNVLGKQNNHTMPSKTYLKSKSHVNNEYLKKTRIQVTCIVYIFMLS